MSMSAQVILEWLYLPCTLLKMGSLGNSFVAALSAFTNKTSQGCLNFLKGVPLLPSFTPLGCFITLLTIFGKEK